MQSFHISEPRVVTVDKNPAYPIAVEELRKEKKMSLGIQLRQVKYLNNIVEQDHRFIKKRVRSMLGLKSFRTATAIIFGIEAMHMGKKRVTYFAGQVCPKSSGVHPSTIWNCCLRLDSTRKLFASLYLS